LKRDGVQIERVPENKMKEMFRSISLGELTKEALPEVFSWLSKHEDKSFQEAIDSLGLRMFSNTEVEKIIDTIIDANKGLIEERRASAFGLIMGMIMKEVRGKANAALVSELLKKKLKNLRNN